jgi:predicted small lipoprotein YifL
MPGCTRTIVLTAAVALAVTACGQKGPLYLPGYPKGATWPYPPKPPAQPAERKTPDVPASTDEKK